jgi:membrane protease subunit (stomatin/prohibitin family)
MDSLFFTSVLVGVEWSASRPGRYPGERTSGWVDLRQSGRYGYIKIVDPTVALTMTPQSSSPYPVAIPADLPWLLKRNMYVLIEFLIEMGILIELCLYL